MTLHRKDPSAGGRMRRAALFALLCAVITVSACGKKGPLYLPKDAAATTQPDAAAIFAPPERI